MLNFSLEQLVRRGLRGVWVRGQLPATATVWAANHHSWWDGFVAGAVLGQQGRAAALLMEGDNLDRFRFLATLGVISTSRPRRALEALRDGRVLVIFPERELRVAGPAGPAGTGSGLVRPAGAGRAGPGRGSDRQPRSSVSRGLRSTSRRRWIRTAWPAALAQQLDRLDAELVEADPREPLPGFGQVVAGRRSWDERIQRWSRSARS